MGSTGKSVVCIVTPGTRTANNGNWRTAARWAGMLRGHVKVIVQSRWDGAACDAMIALHARRSADSIAAYRAAGAGAPLAVMLTGTDLYRDLPGSAEASRSLDLADRIVVLQEDAQRLLPDRWRGKSRVVYQSARPLPPAAKDGESLRCVVVGHLREEKDPGTLFRAVRQLPPGLPISVRHIGAPLDEDLAQQARALEAIEPRYRYAGPLAHGLVRSAIKAVHLLVHPSIMEGGANVIVEAITSGTAVLASRVSGNVGMLGESYPGYFPVGDASALARRLVQAWEDPSYRAQLDHACALRRPLFAPEAESRAVRGLVAELLAGAAARMTA
ncbi:MAG TPA: selenoneine biosynthesis selenosugar synthase SenB [Usitatibacter sp.]|nr:selenoneine biosynthesis selenosugar synthase SenB [Usitatibacter sp.]